VAADDPRREAARATAQYLRREAERGRGDLWTLSAVEPVEPRPERPEAAAAETATGIAAVEALPERVDTERFEPAKSSHPGDTLDGVASEVRGCVKCGLSSTRTNAVPGAGTGKAGIVFIGEAPGAEEDRRGEPFVGRSGDLLTKILQAMDEKELIPGVSLARDSVYIANVLKCRPPENRNPLPHEIEACSPYLVRQLALLKPRVIVCLGKFAAELLVGAKGTVGGMRGQVYRYGDSKLIVTYHPAACLRNPNFKRPVWDDMQLVAREYQTA
jgi:DNA polymerase